MISFVRKLFPPRSPKRVDVELTNICNLRCVMCPISKMTRKKGYMSTEMFDNIISECQKNRVKNIVMSFMGESMLHPEFSRFVKSSKQFIPNVGLNTNGHFLTPEISKSIVDFGLDWILFSVDSVTSDIYSKIRVNGHYEDVVNNIEKLFEIRKSNKPKISLLFIEQKSNLHERHLFIDKWRPYLRGDDSIVIKYPNDWARSVEDQGTFNTKPYSGICMSVYNTMTISWSGDVVLCCVDFDAQHIIGNIGVDSMKDIWNRYPIYQRLVNNRSLKICRDCDMTSGRSYLNQNIYA